MNRLTFNAPKSSTLAAQYKNQPFCGVFWLLFQKTVKSVEKAD